MALNRNAEALPEDCARNDLVIAYPRIEACPNGTPLIGPNALRASGGLALWLAPDGIPAGKRARGARRSPVDAPYRAAGKLTGLSAIYRPDRTKIPSRR